MDLEGGTSMENLKRESEEGTKGGVCTVCGKMSSPEEPSFLLKCGHRVHLRYCPLQLVQPTDVAPTCCTQDVTSPADLLDDVMVYITRAFPKTINTPNFTRHGREYMDELADYIFRYHESHGDA